MEGRGRGGGGLNTMTQEHGAEGVLPQPGFVLLWPPAVSPVIYYENVELKKQMSFLVSEFREIPFLFLFVFSANVQSR